MSWPSEFKLSWKRANLVLVVVWAIIYLPGLGSLDLEHEEPRRALPALHMLSSGDWLVPRVTAEPYLSKPPLLNWLIAASIGATGRPSEWAIRLPSVLATLAVAMVLLNVAATWLGLKGGLYAALLFLVNFTMVETGRLAEIEAIYIAVTGIAIVIWLAAWMRGAEAWSLWLLPAPFLALGMLAKGPAHLFFFYLVACGVLAYGRCVRLLLHPAHFLSLLLVVGAFLAWAVPCSLAVHVDGPSKVWGVWIDQVATRASGRPSVYFHWGTWLFNWAQSLKNYLPWTILLPFLWHPQVERCWRDLKRSDQPAPDFRLAALLRGNRAALVIGYVALSLLPNSSPRYLYPLIVVPCLLLAWLFIEPRVKPILRLILGGWRWFNLFCLGLAALILATVPWVEYPAWFALLCALGAVGLAVVGLSAIWRLEPREPGRQAIASTVACMLGMLIFAVIAMPQVNRHKLGRPSQIAAVIRSHVPRDQILWVQEDDYRPFWFYLEPKVRYFRDPRNIPADAQFFLVPVARIDELRRDRPEQPLTPLAQIDDPEKRKYEVLTSVPLATRN